jgi:hypothetical protein
LARVAGRSEFGIWCEKILSTTRLASGRRIGIELPVEPDGLRFLPESVMAAPIREEAAYPGTRVTLEARLENARVSLQVDIGFGDVVTPAHHR